MGMEMNIARILFEFREKQDLKILGIKEDDDRVIIVSVLVGV